MIVIGLDVHKHSLTAATVPAGARGSVSVFAGALAVRPSNAWITRVSDE